MKNLVSHLPALVASVSLLFSSVTMPAAQMEPWEIESAALETYLYAYPLVLMEVTRKVSTNVAEPNHASLRAPMNQFAHAPRFPDHTFTDVVRANADTLYSILWFDVSQEPLVISVPDSGGRFYLLPMLDMWSDTFAVPGKRATGTAPQVLALTGPGWRGDLPAGITQIQAPTPYGWIVGRTQTNGAADYAAVQAFQKGIEARPLSALGNKEWTPARGTVDPKVNMSAPAEQVDAMDAPTFYGQFLELLAINPPHQNDQTVLMRINRLGLAQGSDFSALPEPVQKALAEAPAKARALYLARNQSLSRTVNHWSMLTQPIGTYGTDFFKRAYVAYYGLGALPLEDAFYPTSMLNAQGKPLYDSAKKYTMHFTKEQIPAVHAFWSLTMYNDRQFFAENKLNRFAIGDRDNLKYAPDGSLTLYLQRESPGKDRESNWLPAPASGSFSLTMRLYWPASSMTDGSWQIPAVIEQP